jgi:hypothetical protein
VVRPAAERLPRISLLLLSASALGYEILLTRLFAIVQWHHFAYMVISLALLGYGASGSFVSIARERLLPHFRAVYPACLAAFGITAVGCYLVAQQVPFHPDELLWTLDQAGRLLLIYLLLALPFFFAATGIALALVQHRSAVSQLYAMDLLGAAIGSLAVIALLFTVQPMTALRLLGAAALLAALVGGLECRSGRGAALVPLALLVGLLAVPDSWMRLAVSPYKGLSQALNIPSSRILAQRSGPLGQLTVVDSPAIPWRHAPGLSLLADSAPPRQLAVFTDGEGIMALNQHSDEPADLAYLDQLTSALPYHLGSPRRVLLLGAGTGIDLLQARYHQVSQVDAVELNPQLVELVQGRFGDFSGRPFSQPGVKLHVGEARGFVADSEDRWELIQIALLDSFAASSAGLYALNESYLYTEQALAEYLAHLVPGGQLAITRWVKLPPRDNLKLLATAAAVLQRSGVPDPAQRLVMIRSWQTATLLIRNGPYGADDIARLREFCAARGFDLVYYPGMQREEANRHNILREPYFFDAAQALLLGEGERWLRDYKFDLTPATDDRPYFFHFFSWPLLPELLQLRGRGGTHLMDVGYLVLLVTLLQALLASTVLILLPLWLARCRGGPPRVARHGRTAVLLFFSAVGIGFLFLEIAFIQRFILFLHHPLYAVSVVLAGFLLFAGLGSGYSRRLAQAGRQAAGIRAAVAGIAILTLCYLVLLGPLFTLFGGLSLPLKVMLSLLLIAPLAFCMGMPFPLALGLLGRWAPSLLPWAWAVNGCASVVSAALATLLAIEFGFSLVLVVAVLMYLVAALAYPALPSPPGQGPAAAPPEQR